MISEISTIGFIGCYCVALALEVIRAASRGRISRPPIVAFATVGFVAHTLYLADRATSASTIPLSSAFEWYLLAAWALVAIYLYFAFFPSLTAIGAFLLPLALGLIAASYFASKTPFPRTPATQVWGAIHGVFWLLGAVAVIVGFVAGTIYLWQAYRLKHKRPPLIGIPLPSLERLEHLNGRAIVLSAIMVGSGVLSGLVLNVINHQNSHDESLPWTDPIVWRSIGMFAWLLAAVVFTALYRPARRGRKVAYLTVASFLFLAIFLAVQLFDKTRHDRGGEHAGKFGRSRLLQSEARHVERVCHALAVSPGGFPA